MVTPQKGAEKSKPILQKKHVICTFLSFLLVTKRNNFKKKQVFHDIPRYTQCIPCLFQFAVYPLLNHVFFFHAFGRSSPSLSSVGGLGPSLFVTFIAFGAFTHAFYLVRKASQVLKLWSIYVSDKAPQFGEFPASHVS